MEKVDKLGTVDGVSGCESAAREDTQLEELSDGPVLKNPYIQIKHSVT